MTTTRLAAVLGWTVGLVMALPAGASAQGAGETVGMEPSLAVIEIYLKDIDSPASPDYSKSIAYSLTSTGRYAVMERDEVAARFKSVLITPVRRLQMERLESIERLVREGDQLVYTDPKAAVDVLNRARSQLESIAEGLAANERLRHEFLKTQMLLARSHLDSGNESKALETLREVIRIYGDGLEVTERDYHPRLVALFRKAKAAMDGERVATLSVETAVPGCETLLDGRPLRGETPREYKALYAGLHHVQVRCGAKESMIRRVVLKKDEPVHLLVDVAFENALTVENGRLGLLFESTAEAAAFAVPFAAKFGSLVNADLVTVHGFLESGTRVELKGRLIDVKKAAEVRSASVPAKTDVVTPSSVKRLVQVLTGSDEGRIATLPAGGNGGGSQGGETPGRQRWYKSAVGWVLTGLGVAGLAAGGGLAAVYADEKSKATAAWPAASANWTAAQWNTALKVRSSHADKANKMRTGAIASFAAGGALVVGGVVVFILNEKGVMSAREPGGDGGKVRFAAAPVTLPGGGGGFVGTLQF